MFPLTHNKREFIRESAEYRRRNNSLRKEFEEIVRLARQRALRRTRLRRPSGAELEKIKDAITDVLRKSEFKLVHRLPRWAGGDETGSLWANPKRCQSNSGNKMALPSRRSPRLRRRNHTRNQGTQAQQNPREAAWQSIRIHGKSVNFEHQFAPLGVNESWKRWHFDPAKGLDIYTNIEFPAYLVTRAQVFLRNSAHRRIDRRTMGSRVKGRKRTHRRAQGTDPPAGVRDA